MRRVNKDERVRVALTLNGKKLSAEAEPRLLLSDFLRQSLGATGTHVGCEHGVCGACTVLIDGVAVRSCLTLAVQAEGRDVRTVESLAAPDGTLNALQAAFRANHALQCGFCTPGIRAIRIRTKAKSAMSCPGISAAAPATPISLRRLKRLLHPPPRKRGRGTTRRVVEGARDSPFHFRRKQIR
jgi:aerobic-type carbon monoxide dehydrogenase small subunit (CoxS/CutS family)